MGAGARLAEMAARACCARGHAARVALGGPRAVAARGGARQLRAHSQGSARGRDQPVSVLGARLAARPLAAVWTRARGRSRAQSPVAYAGISRGGGALAQGRLAGAVRGARRALAAAAVLFREAAGVGGGGAAAALGAQRAAGVQVQLGRQGELFVMLMLPAGASTGHIRPGHSPCMRRR